MKNMIEKEYDLTIENSKAEMTNITKGHMTINVASLKYDFNFLEAERLRRNCFARRQGICLNRENLE
ncbi:Hypothetical predicted protein [Octopus vulgaris]|uniref:Uncharacterized protein n=1 Tax=Octopus vulgaris TaxID=6645 RepID=A0AA36F353_OCTVU|nr:Hypothetical predicted protein [Octopus vulgaris]